MFEFNRRLKVAYWKDRLVTWARSIFGKFPVTLDKGQEIKPLSERQQETLLAIAHYMSVMSEPAGLRDVAFFLDVQLQAAFEQLRVLEKLGLIGGPAYERRHKALLVRDLPKMVAAADSGHTFELQVVCSKCGAAECQDAFVAECKGVA